MAHVDLEIVLFEHEVFLKLISIQSQGHVNTLARVDGHHRLVFIPIDITIAQSKVLDEFKVVGLEF